MRQLLRIQLTLGQPEIKAEAQALESFGLESKLTNIGGIYLQTNRRDRYKFAILPAKGLLWGKFVFPISDDNPTRIRPYVTYGLIAINLLVFVYELSLTPPQLENFFYTWAVVPKELTRHFSSGELGYQPFPEWITLFTSQFLHGGFLHVAGNMLFLWIFGNNVEDRLGHVKFLIFYLACGALAALSQWYFSSNSTIPSLGASGAIAGVMGAYILRFPKASILTLIPLGILIPIRLPAYAYLGIWFLQQALYGIASLGVPANIGMERGGVAYWAHAGGFVFGAVLGPLLGLFSDSSGTEQKTY